MTQAECIEILNELIKANTSPNRSRSTIASDIGKVYIQKTKAEINPQIIFELDEHYNKDGLGELAHYARKMLNSNRAAIEGMHCNMPYGLLNDIDKSASKAKLIWAVAFIFCRKEIYQLFHQALPMELQKAAEQLTWLPQVRAEVLGQLIGETIVSRSKTYYQSNVELKKVYTALPHKIETWNGNVTFSWPPNIRTFLQNFYP